MQKRQKELSKMLAQEATLYLVSVIRRALSHSVPDKWGGFQYPEL